MRRGIKVQDHEERHALEGQYCPDTQPVVTCIGRAIDLAGSRGIEVNLAQSKGPASVRTKSLSVRHENRSPRSDEWSRCGLEYNMRSTRGYWWVLAPSIALISKSTVQSTNGCVRQLKVDYWLASPWNHVSPLRTTGWLQGTTQSIG